MLPSGLYATPEVGRPVGQHNLRHDLDPMLVQAQIAHKIDVHERYRVDARQRIQTAFAAEQKNFTLPQERQRKLAEIDTLAERNIRLERERYALARVIELPLAGKRFVLVYGDSDDASVTSGTGPFIDCQAAADWFFKGGR